MTDRPREEIEAHEAKMGLDRSEDDARRFLGFVFTRHEMNPSYIKWDGGPVGGLVMENDRGEFGHGGEWCKTFEEAAGRSIAQQRAIYNIHRDRVDLYDAAATEAAHRIAANLKAKYYDEGESRKWDT